MEGMSLGERISLGQLDVELSNLLECEVDSGGDTHPEKGCSDTGPPTNGHSVPSNRYSSRYSVAPALPVKDAGSPSARGVHLQRATSNGLDHPARPVSELIRGTPKSKIITRQPSSSLPTKFKSQGTGASDLRMESSKRLPDRFLPKTLQLTELQDIMAMSGGGSSDSDGDVAGVTLTRGVFVARKFVDWLVASGICADRRNGAFIGRQLQKHKFIRPSVGTAKFSDGLLFFELCVATESQQKLQTAPLLVRILSESKEKRLSLLTLENKRNGSDLSPTSQSEKATKPIMRTGLRLRIKSRSIDNLHQMIPQVPPASSGSKTARSLGRAQGSTLVAAASRDGRVSPSIPNETSPVSTSPISNLLASVGISPRTSFDRNDSSSPKMRLAGADSPKKKFPTTAPPPRSGEGGGSPSETRGIRQPLPPGEAGLSSGRLVNGVKWFTGKR